MNMDIRLPNITATSEAGQLAQMRSYLVQLAQQLNWALRSIETGGAKVVETGAPATAQALQEKTPVATFNDIKSLIIKSADIVNAYYEQINKRLSGLYVAESDFGTYMENTDALISANSTRIDQTYTQVQTISGTVAGIQDEQRSTKAYIRTGKLEETDAYPVYGVEVGQESEIDGQPVFKKFARFTAERLAFYGVDADNPLAYISGTTLYITEANILYRLTIGEYELDASDGLAFV